MHPLKEQTITLRKQGKSYSEIQKEVPVSKGTLSYWLKNIVLLPDEQNRLKVKMNTAGAQALIQRNKDQTKLAVKRATEIRRVAAKEIQKLSKRDLLLIGTSLYWGEGYKRGAESSAWKCVDFANTDPDMIVTMLDFFQKCCSVPKNKIRIHLMLHSKSQERKARLFWSRVTNIP